MSTEPVASTAASAVNSGQITPREVPDMRPILRVSIGGAGTLLPLLTGVAAGIRDAVNARLRAAGSQVRPEVYAAGTSAGAMVAAGLVEGLTSAQMRELCAERTVSGMVGPRRMRALLTNGTHGPLFPSPTLGALATAIAGDRHFSDYRPMEGEAGAQRTVSPPLSIQVWHPLFGTLLLPRDLRRLGVGDMPVAEALEASCRLVGVFPAAPRAEGGTVTTWEHLRDGSTVHRVVANPFEDLPHVIVDPYDVGPTTSHGGMLYPVLDIDVPPLWDRPRPYGDPGVAAHAVFAREPYGSALDLGGTETAAEQFDRGYRSGYFEAMGWPADEVAVKCGPWMTAELEGQPSEVLAKILGRRAPGIFIADVNEITASLARGRGYAPLDARLLTLLRATANRADHRLGFQVMSAVVRAHRDAGRAADGDAVLRQWEVAISSLLHPGAGADGQTSPRARVVALASEAMSMAGTAFWHDASTVIDPDVARGAADRMRIVTNLGRACGMGVSFAAIARAKLSLAAGDIDGAYVATYQISPPTADEANAFDFRQEMERLATRLRAGGHEALAESVHRAADLHGQPPSGDTGASVVAWRPEHMPFERVVLQLTFEVDRLTGDEPWDDVSELVLPAVASAVQWNLDLAQRICATPGVPDADMPNAAVRSLTAAVSWAEIELARGTAESRDRAWDVCSRIVAPLKTDPEPLRREFEDRLDALGRRFQLRADLLPAAAIRIAAASLRPPGDARAVWLSTEAAALLVQGGPLSARAARLEVARRVREVSMSTPGAPIIWVPPATTLPVREQVMDVIRGLGGRVLRFKELRQPPLRPPRNPRVPPLAPRARDASGGGGPAAERDAGSRAPRMPMAMHAPAVTRSAELLHPPVPGGPPATVRNATTTTRGRRNPGADHDVPNMVGTAAL